MAKTTMWADEKQLSGAAVDMSSLVGTWVNFNPDTDHIVKVVVTEHDGEMLIRPYGSGITHLVDWGQNRAIPCAVSGSAEATGFHARYRIGDAQTELAANTKLGILVIQSYTSFQDGSGRLNHYEREFYYRPVTGTVVGNNQVGADFLVGDWANTNSATAWLTGFTIVGDASKLTLHARAASEPTDWGETEATCYRDNVGESAFSASYDLGPFGAILAANTAKGLIVVVAFIRFKDSEHTNYMCREFFARQP